MPLLKSLLISILLISCNNSEKKNKPVKENEILKEKAEIKTHAITEFIPNGFEIVQSENEPNKIMSDFNNDGISDYIVLLASGKNNKDYSNSKDIRLAIYEGVNNGNYKLKSKTGNLTSAFVYNNLHKRVINVVNKNVISLKHQSMRHDYELKFRYENKYKDYMLIATEYNNYGSGGQSGRNVSTNFISGKRISTIDNEKRITNNIVKELKPISTINDDNIYYLISE